MKKYLLYCSLFTLFLGLGANRLLAQTNKIDSVENLLKKTKEDTTRLNLYIFLCFEYHTKDNLKYAVPALKLADALLTKTKNDKERKRILARKADALDVTAIYYEEMGDAVKGAEYAGKGLAIHYENESASGVMEALNRYVFWCNWLGNIHAEYEYLQQTLSIFKKEDYKPGIAKCLKQFAFLYSKQGEVSQALVNYENAISLYTELKDSIQMAQVLTGFYFLKLLPQEKWFHYLRRGITIYEALKDTGGIRQAFLNLGGLYGEINDFNNEIKYYKKSLLKAEEMKDEFWIAVLLDNLSDVYIRQGRLDSALVCSEKAMKLNEALGEYRSISWSLRNIATIYFKSGKYTEAKKYCERSKSIREQNDLVGIPETMLLEVQIDSALHHYAEAFVHYKEYILIRDKLKSEEIKKSATREKFQNEYELRKSKDKAEQDKRDLQQRTIRNAIAGGLLCAVFFLILVYRQRNKLKVEKQRTEDEKRKSDLERQRSETLLLNILPREVAEELKSKGEADARHFDEVTVLFTDFKDFTNLSEKMTARELVQEIHTCFMAFDNIMEKYGIEKIKTIGDSYMCAGGLPVANKTHAIDVVSASIEIQQFILNRVTEMTAKGKDCFQIRIGIHTGPVVAGIVGIKKFAYDIWGDTVNTASRMESSGEVGKINISGITYELVKEQFKCTYRGKIQAKNKGELDMYFVEGRLNEV